VAAVSLNRSWCGEFGLAPAQGFFPNSPPCRDPFAVGSFGKECVRTSENSPVFCKVRRTGARRQDSLATSHRPRFYLRMLKPLPALTDPDPRFRALIHLDTATGRQRPMTIGDLHAMMDPLELRIEVPAEVRSSSTRHATRSSIHGSAMTLRRSPRLMRMARWKTGYASAQRKLEPSQNVKA
jgi:hypothetical protein